MPITYTIDRQQNLIHTMGAGDITFAEVLDHFQALAADPAFNPGTDVLLDLLGCTSPPSNAQVREAAAFLEHRSVRLRFGRCAVVASQDVMYGMMRIFQVFAESAFASIRVFRNLEDARLWLNASPSEE